MAEERGVREEEGEDEDEDQGPCPGGYGVGSEREGRIGARELDGFGAEEQEDPDAGAEDGGVGAQDEAFEEGVEAAGEGGECCLGLSEVGWDGMEGELGVMNIRPKKRMRDTSVPFSASKRSTKGTRARRSRVAWKKLWWKSGKVFSL
jgi:hypothetical protein